MATAEDEGIAITPETRISTILKQYPAAIDVLTQISKHFKRLRNPLLRKTLAHRVTVKQASQIGKVSVQAFLEKLAKAGYPIVYQDTQSVSQVSYYPIPEKDWNQMNRGKIVEIDARPDIEAGRAPFQRIMQAIKRVPLDGFLMVINGFEPCPLVEVMTQKGWRTRFHYEPDAVKTYFQHLGKATDDLPSEPEKGAVFSGNQFDEWVAAFGDHLWKLDVREMEMPHPMVIIQQKLPDLPEGYGLFIHHQRILKFLLPQLDEQGWQYCFKQVGGEGVKMIIYATNEQW
jgi:hypothetical protein